ncbi:MAG: hypothetical protein AVDCRST_MAG76-3408, partial [uncultured Acidimicrobiales bacterium]
ETSGPRRRCCRGRAGRGRHHRGRRAPVDVRRGRRQPAGGLRPGPCVRRGGDLQGHARVRPGRRPRGSHRLRLCRRRGARRGHQAARARSRLGGRARRPRRRPRPGARLAQRRLPHRAGRTPR